MKTRTWLHCLVRAVPAVSCALTCSFGAASAIGGDAYWVFFGTSTSGASKGIYVSRMDDSGKLSAPVLAAETANPTFLAIKPGSNPLLFAANEINDFGGKKSGAVSAFAIDAAAGKLTLLNQQPSGGEGPCHVSVDATGREVLVANYGGGSVESLPVKADGSLGEPVDFVQHRGSGVNPQRQAGPHAHCIIVSPDNRYAYACDLGVDRIFRYRLGPEKATLTPVLTVNSQPFTKVEPGAGPRHLIFTSFSPYNPKARFAYLLNEMGCTIDAFTYSPSIGILEKIQTVPALPADKPVQATYTAAEIVVHPSGKFLYASVRGPDLISAFQIDETTGKLTFIESIPSGGKTPRNFNIDPSGHFLLAANQNSDSVVVFSIDPNTGRLTPTGESHAIGKPMCVVFVPVPNRVYADPGKAP